MVDKKVIQEKKPKCFGQRIPASGDWEDCKTCPHKNECAWKMLVNAEHRIQDSCKKYKRRGW